MMGFFSVIEFWGEIWFHRCDWKQLQKHSKFAQEDVNGILEFLIPKRGVKLGAKNLKEYTFYMFLLLVMRVAY